MMTSGFLERSPAHPKDDDRIVPPDFRLPAGPGTLSNGTMRQDTAMTGYPASDLIALAVYSVVVLLRSLLALGVCPGVGPANAGRGRRSTQLPHL